MARNRIFYPVNALFVGPSGSFPATGQHFQSGNSGINYVKQLHRIQSANFSFNISRTDINQFGAVAAVGREIIQQPTVNLDFSYYVNSVANEDFIGMYVEADNLSCVKNLLDKSRDEKNYFLAIAPEGQDQIGWSGQSSVIGIGNGFISSYSTEASVGGIPTASVSIEGLNIKFDTTSTGINIPAINPVDGTSISTWKATIPTGVSGVAGTVSALRPGDIEFTLAQPDFGPLISDAKIQSYNISFDLSRENLEKIGSRFAFSKEIQFPVTVSFSVTANMGDLTTGSLNSILGTDNTYDATIKLREANLVAGAGAVAVQYQLKKLKLDSQDFSNDIGSSSSVTMNFSTQISGPQDTTVGLFITGKK